jgi:putative flippase GtrA
MHFGNMKLARQFLSFGVVGTVGFIVDAGVLTLVLETSSRGLYVGRLISFVSAATVTWALNRRYTFGDAEKSKRFGQWARFLVVNSGGGLINYATYAVLVSTLAIFHDGPVLAVAIGSLAGLAVNFLFSKLFVFKAKSNGEPGGFNSRFT